MNEKKQRFKKSNKKISDWTPFAKTHVSLGTYGIVVKEFNLQPFLLKFQMRKRI